MELPQRFVERMRDMLGDEYDDFYDALLNSPIRTGIRINTLKNGAKDAVLTEFGECESIEWCKNGYYVEKSTVSGNHPYHMAGLFYFQEPSAMSVVEGIDIEEGDFVLDLCAAPGGKSTQAAAKLNGYGLLVSNEIVEKRARILSENIERMGIKNAVVTNETPQKLAQKYPEFFDKIIVDAPCSGEGMFKKEPQAIDEWSEEHTISCGVRQKNIIDSAMKMLKAGGELIYSTCTFSPDENEMVADYILSNYPTVLVPMDSLSMLTPGSGVWGKTDKDMSLTRRIFPHKQNGEGHFAAKFKKLDGGLQRPAVKVSKTDISLYREFEKKSMNTVLNGNFKMFGDNLYLLPDGIDIDKIRVLRAGLHLGVMKKNRFEPSLSMALAMEKADFKNVLECDETSIHSYLTGNTLECDKKGWCVVTYNGFIVGWGKASDGVLKNHYPKSLRLLK